MKFRKISQYFLAASLALATSCSKDNLEELKPENTSLKGKIIIANEGYFPNPNASISVVNEDLSQARNNIYGTANGDAILGDVLQHIGFNGNYAYLVVNNSNRVSVVDRETFKEVKSITEGIKQPRYVAFNNAYTYVTNNTYLGEQKVSIYKSSDFSYVKSIPFAAASVVEQVAAAGDKIFVQRRLYKHNDMYNYKEIVDSKELAVINTTTNDIEKTITLNEDINSIISYNNYLYVLSADANSTKISVINPSTNMVTSSNTYAVGKGSKLRIDQGNLYFAVDSSIYKVDLANAPEAKLFLDLKKYKYFYGFDVINGKVYTSDANGFKSDSDVTVYSAKDASLLQTFKTGIGTNGFYLNK